MRGRPSLRWGSLRSLLGARSLRDRLARLAAEAEALEPGGELLAWGRTAFGLSPEAEADWYRRAWWGFHACRLVRTFLRRGRVEEVFDLVRPPDLGPLDAALAKGKGALLATAHVGPSGVDRMLFTRTRHDVLLLATHRWPVHPRLRIIQVSQPAERKVALAAALLHLRRNGVVMMAADGEWGEPGPPLPFLHHTVRLGRGSAELARLAGAPTLWLSSLWEPATRAIRIALEPSGLEPPGDPEAWEHEWMGAYLAHLRDLLCQNPESLGLSAGIWEPRAEEGLGPPVRAAPRDPGDRQ